VKFFGWKPEEKSTECFSDEIPNNLSSVSLLLFQKFKMVGSEIGTEVP